MAPLSAVEPPQSLEELIVVYGLLARRIVDDFFELGLRRCYFRCDRGSGAGGANAPRLVLRGARSIHQPSFQGARGGARLHGASMDKPRIGATICLSSRRNNCRRWAAKADCCGPGGHRCANGRQSARAVRSTDTREREDLRRAKLSASAIHPVRC